MSDFFLTFEMIIDQPDQEILDCGDFTYTLFMIKDGAEVDIPDFMTFDDVGREIEIYSLSVGDKGNYTMKLVSQLNVDVIAEYEFQVEVGGCTVEEITTQSGDAYYSYEINQDEMMIPTLPF